MQQCGSGPRQSFVLLKACHILCMVRAHMWCKEDCNAVRCHNSDSLYLPNSNGTEGRGIHMVRVHNPFKSLSSFCCNLCC